MGALADQTELPHLRRPILTEQQRRQRIIKAGILDLNTVNDKVGAHLNSVEAPADQTELPQLRRPILTELQRRQKIIKAGILDLNTVNGKVGAHLNSVKAGELTELRKRQMALNATIKNLLQSGANLRPVTTVNNVMTEEQCNMIISDLREQIFGMQTAIDMTDRRKDGWSKYPRARAQLKQEIETL